MDIGRCQKALQIRNGRGVYHTATAATAAGYRPSDALRSIAEMEFRAAFRNGDTKKMDELLSLDYYDGDPDERISHDDEVLDSWKA